MKQLLKVAKLAVICYAGVKVGEAIGNAIVDKIKKEESEECTPVEEIKIDKTTKAILVTGGVAIGTIMMAIRTLQAHAIYVDKMLCNGYDRDLLIYGAALTKCSDEPTKDRIEAILSLSDKAINPETKAALRDLVAEVK